MLDMPIVAFVVVSGDYSLSLPAIALPEWCTDSQVDQVNQVKLQVSASVKGSK